MALQAKDLYGAKNYTISNATKKYAAAYDFSLDLIKLKEVYEKVYRNKRFSFSDKFKEYTNELINVSFQYAYKEFNKSGKNTFIKAGYSFCDCKFEDCLAFDGTKLVGVQTNVRVNSPAPPEVLGKYFVYKDDCYKQEGSLPTLMNRAELRQFLYENGFVVNGKKYVRYKRSNGSARVGKVLFVDEALAQRMKKWDKCGLDVRDGQKIDLAAYEAYISLPMSSIIDTIEIKPENILLIDDYESIFQDDIVAVEYENGELVSSHKTTTVTNSIWDGQSLMDVSLFGDYADKGMLLLRNQFFKSCAFNTNIQKFFADSGVTDVSQLNGATLAKDISDIKLITTPSSVKYLKFGTFEQWLENISPIFGIVKYEKKTHYADGDMVQAHYQLLNTTQLSYADVQKLVQPSLDYITAIRQDPDILKYHIKYPWLSFDYTAAKNKNEIVFKMLGINNDFSKTKLYRDFRDDLVKAFMRNLKQGHILVNGNYSTICANPFEMLTASIGKFLGESNVGIGNIYSKRFEKNQIILGSRSPHILAGNIYLAKNVQNLTIDEYFNFTAEIVGINLINENLSERLNGSDEDGDTILLTDNSILIGAAKKNYDFFKVPTNLIPADKTPRYYTAEQQADLDIKTSVNKIGEIVNLSQQLNSILWDEVTKGKSLESQENLYIDICKLAVLSGIEIDSAKKTYPVDTVYEIDKIKRKYKMAKNGKAVKPYFFRMITTENGYKLSPNAVYTYFETSMDYLQKIVNKYNFYRYRESKDNLLPFMELINKVPMASSQGYYWNIKNETMAFIRKKKKELNSLYAGYDNKTAEEKGVIREQAKMTKAEMVAQLNMATWNKLVTYLIIKEIDCSQNQDIANFLFETLFSLPCESFYDLLIENKQDMYELIESKDGDIHLYDKRFFKQKVTQNQ